MGAKHMKYRSMENRFCMSLVAFAVIVRLLLATGVSAALDSAVGLAPKLEAPDEPDVFLLEILEPETAPSEPPVQPEIAAASEAPAEQETEAEPVDPPLVFSADEADAIGIVGACSYQPDKQALLTRPSALSLSDDGPAVLIVHTHSSEAYTMEAGFEYQESDALRTLDERYSVIRVGDEIADILTEAAFLSCTTRSRTIIRITTAPTSVCGRPSRAIWQNIRPFRWCWISIATRLRTQTGTRSR